MNSNLIFANNVAANTPLPLLAAGSCAWIYMGRQLTKGNCGAKLAGSALIVAGTAGLLITANQASHGSIKESITGFGTGMVNVCHFLKNRAATYSDNAISLLTSKSPSLAGVGMTGLGVFGAIALTTGISQCCRASKYTGIAFSTAGVPALAIAANYAGNNFLVENALQLSEWAGYAKHQVTSDFESYVSKIETHLEVATGISLVGVATGISLAALATGVGLTWKGNRLAKVIGSVTTIGSLIALGTLTKESIQAV